MKVVETRRLLRGKTSYKQEVAFVTEGAPHTKVKTINLSATKLRTDLKSTYEVVYSNGSTELVDEMTITQWENRLGA